MSVSLPQLRALVAVADAGSFSAAADRLKVSQSAVSHAIAVLERSAHRPVLSRGASSKPTLFGDQLLVHARSALAAISSFEELVRQRDVGLAGDLVLAAPPTVCHSLVPELLSLWAVEFPDVRVSLFEGDDDEIAGWLDGATADLAVLIDPGEVPAGAVDLATDQFHAVVREDHPLAAQPVVDLADLEDDPFLLSAAGCERHIRNLHAMAGIPFRPAHRARQLATLFSMIRAGVGVSLVPSLASGMEGPGLRLIPLRQQLHRTLVLTGPRHRSWHPATEALLAVLRRSRAA